MKLRRTSTRKAYLVLNSKRDMEEDSEIFNIYKEENNSNSQRDNNQRIIRSILGSESEIFGLEKNTELVDSLTYFHRRIMRKFISECWREINIFFVINENNGIISGFLQNVLIKILRNLKIEMRKLGERKEVYALETNERGENNVQITEDVITEDIRHLCGNLHKTPLKILILDFEQNFTQTFNFWVFSQNRVNNLNLERVVRDNPAEMNFILGLTSTVNFKQGGLRNLKITTEKIFKILENEKKDNKKNFEDDYSLHEYSESLSTIKTNHLASPRFEKMSQNKENFFEEKKILQEKKNIYNKDYSDPRGTVTTNAEPYKNYISNRGYPVRKMNPVEDKGGSSVMSRYPSTGLIKKHKKIKTEGRDDISRINSKIDKMMSLILNNSNMNSVTLNNRKFSTPCVQNSRNEYENIRKNCNVDFMKKGKSALIRNNRNSQNSTQTTSSFENFHREYSSNLRPQSRENLFKKGKSEENRRGKIQEEFYSKLMKSNIKYRTEFTKMKSELNDLYRIFKAQKKDPEKENIAEFVANVKLKNFSSKKKKSRTKKKKSYSRSKLRKQRLFMSPKGNSTKISSQNKIFKTNPKILARRKPSICSVTTQNQNHRRNMSVGCNNNNFLFSKFNKIETQLSSIEKKLKKKNKGRRKNSVILYNLPPKISIEENLDKSYIAREPKKRNNFFSRTKKDRSYQEKYVKLREKIKSFNNIMESDLNLLRHRVKSIDSKQLINDIATRCRALGLETEED